VHFGEVAPRQVWTAVRDAAGHAADPYLRQLWERGWLHNRARMATASFLTKDLLIDWREGARWYWETLVDADLANNTLDWRWVAGSGADAAPYHRIFNPDTQAARPDRRPRAGPQARARRVRGGQAFPGCAGQTTCTRPFVNVVASKPVDDPTPCPRGWTPPPPANRPLCVTHRMRCPTRTSLPGWKV